MGASKGIFCKNKSDLLSYLEQRRRDEQRARRSVRSLLSETSLHWQQLSDYSGFGLECSHTPESDGVYIIVDAAGYAIYVGQGNIRQRLKDHLSENEPNRALWQIVQQGTQLSAYYAQTESAQMTGIELFLYEKYKGNGKLTNACCPCADSSQKIEVNVPDNLH